MKQIAIDGPAGAGKSTIAKEVSKILGFVYIDTGAMYRTMGLACLKAGIDLADEDKVSDICDTADIDVRYIEGVQHMFLEGEDVSTDIRKNEVSKAASNVSKYQRVRTRLVKLQQELAERYNVVMDGRDIASKVLPDADLKIYLTASVECRALRRYKELIEKGEECELAAIEKEIAERDHNDMTRANSPLVKVDEAIEVDTSDMTITEVVDRILELFGELE